MRHVRVPAIAAVAACGLLAARPAAAQSIATTQLSVAHVGVYYPGAPYIVAVNASCWSWALSAGTLPAGMTIGVLPTGSGNEGEIFGTPTTVGDYPITVRATCSSPPYIEKSFVLSVRPNADAPPSSSEWTPRATLGGTVNRLEISPDYASDGILFASGIGGDLYRTTDRGVTWQRVEVNPAELDAEITGIALSPVFSGGGATPVQRTVFIATREYGIWKSTDLGLTFSPSSSGLPCDGVVACPEGFPDVRALALSPNYAADATLWAVINAPAGGGSSVLYRSLDGGASWSQRGVIVANAINHGVMHLAPSPLFASDNTLFGAGYDVTELQYDAAGIFRSTDGGATWSRVLVGYVSDLSFSPDYATDGRIYGTQLTGVPNVYSTDFGATWPYSNSCKGPVTMVGGGGGPLKRIAFDSEPYLAQYVANPNRYYAVYTYFDDCSKDGYRSLSRGLPIVASSSVGRDEMRLKLSPPVAGVRHYWIYGNYGIFVSLDEGVTFQPRQGFMRNLQVRGLAGSGNATVVAAPGGWLLAENGPAGWIRPFPGVHSWGAAMSPNYATDKTVWLAQNRYSDTPEVLRTTTSGAGANFTGGYYIRDLLFAPGFNTTTGTAFLADATWGSGSPMAYSTNGGQYFNNLYPTTSTCPIGDGNYREVDGAGISPAYATDQTVYAGFTKNDNTGMLCRTTDGGANWSQVPTPAGALGGRIALSPTYDHIGGVNGTPSKTLLFSANNGLVYRSTDGGATWAIPAGLPPSGMFASPRFSPLFALDGTVFLAAGPSQGYPYVPGRQGGIWRSSDYGASFAPLGAGDGLKTRRVTGLHFYPGFDGRLSANSRALAAAEGAGLWLSSDGGRTFAPADDFSQAGRQITLGLASGTDLYFASQERGIARSSDSGLNFAELNGGLPAGFAPRSLGNSSSSTARPLLGLTGNGLWRLDGAGTTWQRVTSAAIANGGTYSGFGEDAANFYALRADGTSARTPKAIGTWTALQASETSLVGLSYNASTGPTTLAGEGTATPKLPAGTNASLWALSATAGPRWSTNSGTNWTAAPGGNDYALPGGQSWKVIQALGINATSGGREVLAGSAAGLWLTRDGGDTWRRVDQAGSGLELTSRDFSAVLTTATPTGATDLLVGATGATTGGVWLSADGGEHWTQVNQGFDPANLSISSLVKTSCAGCPVQYYTGSYGSGVYTRTITVNPPPAVPAVNYACWGSTGCACATAAGSGPEEGGQPFRLCGSGFLNGITVEFDGMAAAGCTQSGGTVVTCAGTPSHVPGSAKVRVRNTDTRTAAVPGVYTYTAGAPRTGTSLRVAKSGADALLTWSCPACTAQDPARVYRAQNAALTLYAEQYNGGAGGSYANAGALSTAFNYFWRVE